MEKYVDEGSDIIEGQKLFKINDVGAYSDFLQAKKELAQKMTALARALAENDPRGYELQLEMEENKAFVKRMEVASEVGIIYAPKSGRLTNVVPLGTPVTKNDTLLATVGNINPVTVNFEISETEANLLSIADDLKITLNLSDGATYSHAGYFKDGAILFDNPDEILPLGKNVQVEINGVKLPNS